MMRSHFDGQLATLADWVVFSVTGVHKGGAL